MFEYTKIEQMKKDNNCQATRNRTKTRDCSTRTLLITRH